MVIELKKIRMSLHWTQNQWKMPMSSHWTQNKWENAHEFTFNLKKGVWCVKIVNSQIEWIGWVLIVMIKKFSDGTSLAKWRRLGWLCTGSCASNRCFRKLCSGRLWQRHTLSYAWLNNKLELCREKSSKSWVVTWWRALETIYWIDD